MAYSKEQTGNPSANLAWESFLAAPATDLPKQSALQWGNTKALVFFYCKYFLCEKQNLFAALCKERF
jgi:hypothetical protein